jgi:hypothetical protein
VNLGVKKKSLRDDRLSSNDKRHQQEQLAAEIFSLSLFSPIMRSVRKSFVGTCLAFGTLRYTHTVVPRGDTVVLYLSHASTVYILYI